MSEVTEWMGKEMTAWEHARRWPRVLLNKISFSPIYRCAQTPALLPGSPADAAGFPLLRQEGLALLPVPALTVIRNWWILFKIQSCSELIDDFQLFPKTEENTDIPFTSVLAYSQCDKTVTLLPPLLDPHKSFSMLPLAGLLPQESFIAISHSRSPKGHSGSPGPGPDVMGMCGNP